MAINTNTGEFYMMICNNTDVDVYPYEAAIREIAAGTADAETVEALADIFALTVLSDRILVGWA